MNKENKDIIVIYLASGENPFCVQEGKNFDFRNHFVNKLSKELGDSCTWININSQILLSKNGVEVEMIGAGKINDRYLKSLHDGHIMEWDRGVSS